MGKLQALGLLNIEETERQNRELDEAKKAGRRSMIRQLRNAKEEREAAADVSDYELDEFDAGLPEADAASDVDETVPEDTDLDLETDTVGDGTDVETDLDGDSDDATDDETLADELGEGSSSADETAGNVTSPVPPAVGDPSINQDGSEESDEEA